MAEKAKTKRKAGTKTSNGVGDVVKEEREGGRENERERVMRSIFIHLVSTNKPCIYSILLGIRIILQNNCANE